MPRLTEQELLNALSGALIQEEDTGAMTAQEIADTLGVGIKLARKHIKDMMSKGLITPVWVRRDTILTPLNGRTVRVPGYRLASGE